MQSLLFRKERSFWSPFLFYLGKQPSSSVVTNTNCSISKRETTYSLNQQKCLIWVFCSQLLGPFWGKSLPALDYNSKFWALSGVILLKGLRITDLSNALIRGESNFDDKYVEKVCSTGQSFIFPKWLVTKSILSITDPFSMENMSREIIGFMSNFIKVFTPTMLGPKLDPAPPTKERTFYLWCISCQPPSKWPEEHGSMMEKSSKDIYGETRVNALGS